MASLLITVASVIRRVFRGLVTDTAAKECATNPVTCLRRLPRIEISQREGRLPLGSTSQMSQPTSASTPWPIVSPSIGRISEHGFPVCVSASDC